MQIHILQCEHTENTHIEINLVKCGNFHGKLFHFSIEKFQAIALMYTLVKWKQEWRNTTWTYSMLNAQCPMLNAQCPLANILQCTLVKTTNKSLKFPTIHLQQCGNVKIGIVVFCLEAVSKRERKQIFFTGILTSYPNLNSVCYLIFKHSQSIWTWFRTFAAMFSKLKWTCFRCWFCRAVSMRTIFGKIISSVSVWSLNGSHLLPINQSSSKW